MSNSFYVHSNNGEVNYAIGDIRADYMVPQGSLLVFYNSESRPVIWYNLQPGEMVSVNYEEDSDEN